MRWMVRIVVGLATYGKVTLTDNIIGDYNSLTGAVPTFARVKLSYKYRLAQNVPSNKKGFQWPKISS